jgi:rhodanese-related sulfurtransferase
MPIPQVQPADVLRQAQAHRAQGRSPVLLDVREPWEVSMAAISCDTLQALRIPMQQVPANLDRLPIGQPVYVLCHHGMRSLHVATFLASQGYTDVRNVTGGIDAWSREVDPTVPSY